MAAALEDYYDVVIVGAGLSGIDAAYRIQERCPNKSYVVLEGRAAMGGTWDLFKYPGVRSDSDLHTFGFPFRPWPYNNAIAEAPLLVQYIRETAEEFGIDKHIHYKKRVNDFDWSSKEQCWTLSVASEDTHTVEVQCQHVLLCTGYYNYKTPLSASIPGLSNFKGTVAHPQFWPEDFDYTGKNIVIIGSGATAVTLVPNLAKKAAHVTMLQRSPSWIAAIPQDDAINRFCRRWLPSRLASRLIRLKYTLTARLSVVLFRKYPNWARKLLRKEAARRLPKDYPLDPNFNPSYNPWDQRLCLSPGGDFYKAIRGGNVTIVTDTIRDIDATTIHLTNNPEQKLTPDLIITATGLTLQTAGGANISVDGSPVNVAQSYIYRHVMLSGIPNMAYFFGYVSASWTLASDATAQYVCRFIRHLDKKGYSSGTPVVRDPERLNDVPFLDLQSTYVKRNESQVPRAADRAPWKPRSWYYADLWEAKFADWREMEFVRKDEGGARKDL